MWQLAAVIFHSVTSSTRCLKKKKAIITSSTYAPPLQPRTASKDAVAVLGLKNILTTYAKCCKPAPGDEIVGYITRGRGATIHRQDCPNMLRMKDRERIVKVTWGEPQNYIPGGDSDQSV